MRLHPSKSRYSDAERAECDRNVIRGLRDRARAFLLAASRAEIHYGEDDIARFIHAFEDLLICFDRAEDACVSVLAAAAERYGAEIDAYRRSGIL